MLYTILFATLIYVNSGQDVVLPDCSSDAECAYLDTDTSAQTLLSIMSVSGESFVCSGRVNYCTLTCGNGADTCTKINDNTLIPITGSECLDEGDGVLKCSFQEDTSCTDSADCVAKTFGDLLPRCDNPNGETDGGTCVEQTDTPTTSPVTKQPTDRPITASPNATPMPTDTPVTPMPTDAPSTTQDGIEACIAKCEIDADNDVAMFCSADIDYPIPNQDNFVLSIPCQDVANECQANCLVNGNFEYYTKDLGSGTKDLISGLYSDPVAEFCDDGSCDDTTTQQPTTAQRTTAGPTTASPTTAEFGECIDECVNDADNYMYCEGDETIYGQEISIPCTDVRNKCEAQCLVDAKKAELTADLGLDEATVNAGIASLYQYGLVNAFCFNGTCDGDDEPTTTSMDEPTTTSMDEPTTTSMDISTTDACQDPDYDVDDCPVETGDGCSVQFNVTIDFCILNRKFKRRQIWRYAKLAYMYAMETVADYADCVEADLRILRYKPGYRDDNARLSGKKRPTRPRTSANAAECDAFTPGQWEDDDCCEDLDAFCGEDRSNKRFTLELATGFYCGDCDKMKSIVVTIQSLLDQFDTEFVLKCLGLSELGDDLLDLDGDGTCATGFGDVALEIDDAVLAYVNADGVVEVQVGTSNVNAIKYGLSLIVALIMATIY